MVNLNVRIEFKFFCYSGTFGLDVTDTLRTAMVLGLKLTIPVFFLMGNVPFRKKLSA